MNSCTPTSARPRDDSARDQWAHGLALVALPALVLAYASTFVVLGSSDYASKFENGRLPADFDGSGGREAAVVSIVCAALAVVLVVGALAAKVTKATATITLLVVVAVIPYALLELVTWELAF